MAIDTSTILVFFQSHILEIILIVALIFILKNWKLILISILIIGLLSYFGFFDSLLNSIFPSTGVIPFNFLNNSLLNNSINQTLNQSIINFS
ncbi:hypothetical protein J3E06_000521 [Methanococcus voltae]|uniref:Uncharacterized protein n=1 Tax=Methanococcus voltae (strain ATCC BAA-1334 / A3) TaxID=456320 RepID=D7DQQ0_METV3|nr:hypothetical protein [Methanococcus voltae]